MIFFVVSFDNYMQHDAHEFLNYLLNTIADLLQGKNFDNHMVLWWLKKLSSYFTCADASWPE